MAEMLCTVLKRCSSWKPSELKEKEKKKTPTAECFVTFVANSCLVLTLLIHGFSLASSQASQLPRATATVQRQACQLLFRTVAKVFFESFYLYLHSLKVKGNEMPSYVDDTSLYHRNSVTLRCGPSCTINTNKCICKNHI